VRGVLPRDPRDRLAPRTLTAAAAPIAAGRMLGLSAEQIQHAIGISASRHCTTGSVTAGKLTMMKNTVDPLATQSGMLAALLAEQGYTARARARRQGRFSHVFSSDWRFDILTEGLGESWRILQCGMKYFPTEALTHAPISATSTWSSSTTWRRTRSSR